MTSIQEKIIKPKLGLLELAKQLGSVSQACNVMGYSRDSFYRFEPPRFCRRLITPFHATLSNWLHCSQNFSSASAGGMFPMGCSRRRLL
ncbi:MAG: helix-turn-helix domain-containing protein, partial [Mangrovicoccus sp.]|nr:helix-turn-helix domain-containing protein [Mangrovicoccus sp.]